MSIVGSGKTIEYIKRREEERVSDTAVRRRWIDTKTKQADSKSILETQQFTTPTGYDLVQITSRLSAPDYNFGEHVEEYEQVGTWTTTTTTT